MSAKFLAPTAGSAEGHFQLLFDGAPVCIHELDGDGRFVTMNAAGLKMMNLRDQAEIVGLPYLDAVCDEDRPRVAALLARAYEGHSSEFEFMGGAADDPRAFSSSFIPLGGADERVSRIIGVTQDVTQTAQAETDRREAESKYRTLVEQSLVGVYVIQNHRYVYVNPKMSEIFGYARDELEALDNVVTVVAGPDRALVTEQIRRRAAGEVETVHYMFRARHKDGRTLELEVYGNAIQYQGQPAVIGTMLDVTERNQAERALRETEVQLAHAQKMEVVGTLAGGVAHDFNNLLTIVAGHSEWLLEHLPPDDPVTQRVTALQRAALQAAALTQKLLTLSRREAVDRRVLSLNAVLTSVEKLLRRLVGETVDVVVTLAPDGGNITADHDQLEHVVMNLAANARDAMPDGGSLRLTATAVERDASLARRHPESQPGPYMLLAVSDTGCGMDTDIVNRVFEPFFTTKEPGKGTGLGLSMVFGIVRDSGGHISVESSVGRGTTFYLYFPKVEAAVDPVLAGDAPALEGRETILVVEDQTDLRELITAWLLEHGYEVLDACDGSHALDVCASSDRTIDVVLTDVVMPRMSGPELVARLTKDHPGLRVIYMSGYTNDALGDQGFPYLRKPFPLADLALRLREVLERDVPAAGD